MVAEMTQPQITTLIELANELDERYLDWSPPSEDEDGIYNMWVNPNTGLHEIDEAIFWREHARGTMGIFGDPGTGKTLLLTATGRKLSHFFMRPVVSDYYLKQRFIDEVKADAEILARIKAGKITEEWLHGLRPELPTESSLDRFIKQTTTNTIAHAYTYIDEDTLLGDLQEIDKLARNKDWNLNQKHEWVIEGKGSSGVKLHGSTLLISEIDRWVDCRRTGTKIDKLIADLFKRWRHYDILVAGDCVDINDLDRQRIAPRFNCIVYPNPLGDHYFEYVFKSVARLTKGGVVHMATRERIDLYGKDFYWYYVSRNPVPIDPNLRYRESKDKGENKDGI